MGWDGHVARFVFEGNCIHGLGEKPKGHRNDLEDRGVHESVTTQWIIEKSVVRAWIGFLWLRIGISGGELQKQ
jgi:hypothetical protein